MDDLVMEAKAQADWEQEQKDIVNQLEEDEIWRKIMCKED